MSDPFSAAASVAGLISLCASASKLFYQFISSVADAPTEVRTVTSSLCGMNIALCQLQNLLLDVSDVQQTPLDDLGDLGDLERLVTQCVETLSVVESQLKSVSEAGSESFTVKKSWHQVKSVFEREKMKDALARLENEKGTLHLLLNVLNRKLMADVIRVVKNTEQMAGKNNHVLKSLELKVTRVLKDAMGQSHTTSSTISLDSICSQADIERMLTNSGSTLNLTLTDMSDDSASILVIPDSLSLVDYASARIKFPIKSTKDEPKNVAAHIDLQDDIDGPMNSSLPSVTSVEALGTDEVDGTTVSSRLSLDDNDDNISSTSKRTDGGSVTPLAKTTAQQIIEYLHLDKSPLNSYGRKRMPGSRLPDCGKVSNPLSTTALKALDDLINIAETLPTSLTEDLYRARRRLQLYSPVVQFLIMSGRGIENEYIVGCGQEVVKALKTYVGAVDTYMKALGKLYGNKTDWPQLTLSLITSSEGLDELWVSVERSMDDLEKAINMVLQLEVLQKTERVSQESDNED